MHQHWYECFWERSDWLALQPLSLYPMFLWSWTLFRSLLKPQWQILRTHCIFCCTGYAYGVWLQMHSMIQNGTNTSLWWRWISDISSLGHTCLSWCNWPLRPTWALWTRWLIFRTLTPHSLCRRGLDARLPVMPREPGVLYTGPRNIPCPRHNFTGRAMGGGPVLVWEELTIRNAISYRLHSPKPINTHSYIRHIRRAKQSL